MDVENDSRMLSGTRLGILLLLVDLENLMLLSGMEPYLLQSGILDDKYLSLIFRMCVWSKILESP